VSAVQTLASESAGIGAVPRLIKIHAPAGAYLSASPRKELYALARQLSSFCGLQYRVTDSEAECGAIYLYRVRTKAELIPLNPAVLRFVATAPVLQALQSRGFSVEFIADELRIQRELSTT